MSELFFHSVFADNLALAYFLGMCSLIGRPVRMNEVLGIGLLLTLLMAITLPLNRLILEKLLQPGAWTGFPALDLTFLRFIIFMGSITTIVTLAMLAARRFLPALDRWSTPHPGLLPVNCVLLGGSLLMVERSYSAGESFIAGLGGGLGWTLALAAFASIRERMRYCDMPAGLSGAGAGFFIAGFLSMAFLMLGGGARLP